MGEFKIQYDIINQEALMEQDRLSISHLSPDNYGYVYISNTDLIKDAVAKKFGETVYNYIEPFINTNEGHSALFVTTDYRKINIFSHTDAKNFIGIEKINNISNVNKYFKSVNEKLALGGTFVGCAETSGERKNRLVKNKKGLWAKIFRVADFILHRVCPKVEPLGKLYRLAFNNRTIALSKAELLGRLAYCGFEIKDFKSINNLLFFVVSKKSEPQTKSIPSYSPLFKMKRIGKYGKMINVYKIRTMHAYSEYLQEYITRRNGYTNLGKPANDFRLTRWGKLLRKYWLDEILQIINVLKGEMNLVGVRPVSQVRYGQFPEDVQEKRIQFKPGCIPPYVSLIMPDSRQNIEAEKIYMKDKIKHPFTTDVRYFYKAIVNIFTGKIVSA